MIDLIDFNNQNEVSKLRNQFIMMINKYVKNVDLTEMVAIRNELDKMYKYAMYNVAYYPHVKKFYLSDRGNIIDVGLDELSISIK